MRPDNDPSSKFRKSPGPCPPHSCSPAPANLEPARPASPSTPWNMSTAAQASPATLLRFPPGTAQVSRPAHARWRGHTPISQPSPIVMQAQPPPAPNERRPGQVGVVIVAHWPWQTPLKRRAPVLAHGSPSFTGRLMRGPVRNLVPPTQANWSLMSSGPRQQGALKRPAVLSEAN